MTPFFDIISEVHRLYGMAENKSTPKADAMDASIKMHRMNDGIVTDIMVAVKESAVLDESDYNYITSNFTLRNLYNLPSDIDMDRIDRICREIDTFRATTEPEDYASVQKWFYNRIVAGAGQHKIYDRIPDGWKRMPDFYEPVGACAITNGKGWMSGIEIGYIIDWPFVEKLTIEEMEKRKSRNQKRANDEM